MSADNWTKCPKCEAKRQEDIIEMSKKSSDAYGKVSVEQFDHIRQELADLINEDMDLNFREDYEFYMNESGKFYAGYSGSCTECGWEFNFKHEAQAL